jgi:hypothetical protein
MNIPKEGIEVYGTKGMLYENLSMSNKGLIGSGMLRHLTSTTKSEEFRFFPDSMLTQAASFDIEKDGSGVYPVLNSQDVKIKWLTEKDDLLAYNAQGKNFNMFDNGTSLNGSLKLSPKMLNGSGVVNTTDSRITSDLFRFTSNSIKADTSDYDLKSPSTSGYAFIAENSSTDVNFDLKMTRFHLNTDTSVVKFPAI